VRGKASKLGEPCPKVRLSHDRLPIEPSLSFSPSLSLSLYSLFSLSGPLRTNVVRANVASRKCHSTVIFFKFCRLLWNPNANLSQSDFRRMKWFLSRSKSSRRGSRSRHSSTGIRCNAFRCPRTEVAWSKCYTTLYGLKLQMFVIGCWCLYLSDFSS